MKEQGTSTAQRIQRLQSRRTRLVLAAMDIILLLTTVLCWCYLNDSAYLNEYNPFRLLNAVDRAFVFSDTATPGLIWVGYSMSAVGLETVVVDATGLFYVLAAAIPIVLLVQAVIVWIADLFAVRQVRKQLQPLYHLAQAAQELSEESYAPQPQQPEKQDKSAKQADSFERMHTLENAIEQIQPTLPDAMLHTGDRDLKGLEDAINNLLRRTRESYSQQTRFVSDASHELRTPIAVIKGYTDMLDRWGKTDEKVLEESIAAIKSETEQMSVLVEQLLFLARGDSGRNRFSPEQLSVSDLVREVREESAMIDAQHRWLLEARQEVTALADPAMLKQAIRILADNAAKYTPSGETILLRAAYDRDGAPTITVQDNGQGIASGEVSQVFDRFFRSDQARSRRQGGSGLGLSIAKWIVDRHGGYIDLLTSEGIGTRFSIHLPRCDSMQQGK